MEASQILVQCKAGKMKLEDKKLFPDKRKGMLRVTKTFDTLTHIEWCERDDTGDIKTAEVDVIVFPMEAVLEQIPGKRVAVLKFPEDHSRDMFFWLQEPEDKGDASFIEQFNKAINPPLDLDMAPAMAAAEAEVGMSDAIATSSLERAHVSTASGAGLETSTAEETGLLPSGPAQNLLPIEPTTTPSEASALAAILSNALASASGSAQRPAASSTDALARALAAQFAAYQAGAQHAGPDAGPSLDEVLRPEVLAPILRQPGVLSALQEHLPEEHRNAEALAGLAHSPQFRQQLHTFSLALQSGQLDLRQFGLNAAGFSVADFLQAIQDLVDRQQQQGGGQGGSAPMEQ